jgi:hypothetical protein
VFLAGLVVGGLIVYGLHAKHWLPNSGQRHVEAFSEVPDQEGGVLAARFRPWLEFDSSEHWRPLNVSLLFDEGTSTFCTRGSDQSCVPVPDAAAFGLLARKAGALGPNTFVNLAGTKVRDYHGPEQCAPLEDCGSGPRSAIYYHVTQSNDRFYIDYWWFLRFNHFPRSLPWASCRSQLARDNSICDEHEGDWEGVTVVTPPDDDKQIDYVVYAAHKGTFRYAASELSLVDGTRPKVYVAQGSHASYPAPCSGDCHQPSGLAVEGLVDLPESSFDGHDDWVRDKDNCEPNAPGSCLQSLSLQPWTTWPGQWGAGCGDACGGATTATSPRSPGLQPRYQTPWCSSQNGSLTCDSRALRCSDWLGPLVVAVACDPVLLSQGLRATNAIQPGQLALVIAGQQKSTASTPGVVQALGQPLEPGAKLTVVADGPSTQILVRAQQASVIAEDRFAGLNVQPGQQIQVTVSAGPDGPTVLADGHAAVERRFLDVGTTTPRP